jgi:hypothetical protein
MCAVVCVMFLRTHFVRKSEASDMTTILSTSDAASSNTSEAAELELLDYARGRLMTLASVFGQLE